MATICSGPPSTLSIDAIGKDLLMTLLTSLSLELCIPIFLDRNIDVFRWLGMKKADDFAAIGIDSPEVCQQLAHFTCALGRHLNGLSPLLSSQEDDMNDNNIHDRQRLEKAIQRAVAVFEHYTRPLPSSPDRQLHQQKSIRWSSTLSVSGDQTSALPSSSSTPQPPSVSNTPSDNSPPPSYYDSNNDNKKANKATGLIKRLSLRQRSRPRPISMPARSSSADNSTEQQRQNSTHLRLRRLSIRSQQQRDIGPSPQPQEQQQQQQQIQQQQQQQQQQQRDQYLRKRWEKCRSCVILPREEEGREELPAYRCTVYKMGYVYVKREMDTPWSKCRRRAWKKLYVELWGTMLRFYQPKTSAATMDRTSSFYYNCSKTGYLPPTQCLAGMNDDDDDDTPLASFLHPTRLRTFSSTSSSSSASSSTSSLGASPIHIATNATYNLIRRSSHYKQHTTPLDTISLARAEASRAWDYIKRPNTLRLTIDQGPRFLLRLPSQLEMISWIEHLQAAINISLDLEFRPMPKFMTLPTRISATTSNDPRVLQLERAREQRFRNQYEMLI